MTDFQSEASTEVYLAEMCLKSIKHQVDDEYEEEVNSIIDDLKTLRFELTDKPFYDGSDEVDGLLVGGNTRSDSTEVEK